MTSPASDYSESATAQPLLQDFHPSKERTQSNVSLASLEHGEDANREFRHLGPHRRPAFWKRLRMSMRRRQNGVVPSEDFKSVKLGADDKKKSQRFRWRKRTFLGIPVLVMIVFGLIHLVNFFFGYVPLLWDDPASTSLDWTVPGQLLDITRDVTPVPCHSHNDYWRRVPLYDALRWGCTGVEADVWLFDKELLVGHSTNALTQNRTFRSMYVDPLVKMLDHKNQLGNYAATSSIKNGIFDTVPKQTLVLLIDFKNDGRDIFPVVSSQLSALREKGYLTYFDGEKTIPGAITVVATGNAPFDLVTANSTYRDIFFDAPLAQMSSDAALNPQGGQGTIGTTPDSHFDSTNSYYASVDFRKSIGFVWWGSLSEKQLELIRSQIRGAHERGLKARYWSAPKWPIALRNRVWRVLVAEGVDYLNGDDLQGMTRLDWGVKKHWSLAG
ncbi:altered inheritance of mitochondria protein 6 [Parastagonospora nodorum]|nr:altered inheritance of mitochondria protein 6 [Parastagonospora nodorum]KAH5649041.1 altered inheritance of mitochondria protein 6 [Parastagonospora nodorum]KAH6055440.1 altered inheritance of mitochondria protein 6 [Parastagonospora nodorum]KAH6064736.1 altered inheritance of mitochondria protein 6 [Parastagonospora nodorum]